MTCRANLALFPDIVHLQSSLPCSTTSKSSVASINQRCRKKAKLGIVRDVSRVVWLPFDACHHNAAHEISLEDDVHENGR